MDLDLSYQDAAAAVARAVIISWSGSAWRIHRRKYDATSHRGSEIVSGRYNRAPDRFPPELCFPALYTSTAPEVCLAELLRHTHPDDLAQVRETRLSELWISLQMVLDARSPEPLGLSTEALLAPQDYELGQQLAAATIGRGCDGLLVPSATGLGDNLIVFPTGRSPPSRVQLVGHRDLEGVYYVGA